jgi:hypothetical protein
MLVSPGNASAASLLAASDDAALLEALAAAGDALTAALVAHDLDGIADATNAAEALCVQLQAVDRPRDARRRDREKRAEIVARIGAAARRNAVLLESAWVTDAAILRLLAAAAVEQVEPPSPYHAPAAGATPAGWLDRSA